MRGKVGGDGLETGNVRITPAYAGKSEFPPAFTKVSRDHPRLCGEKPSMNKFPSTEIGSPPPMRGKELPAYATSNYYRITPAYAGKSSLVADTQRRRQDHPRLCGEKGSLRESTRSSAGSPPPMRGKVDVINKLPGINRITPAYAGKRV